MWSGKSWFSQPPTTTLYILWLASVMIHQTAIKDKTLLSELHDVGLAEAGNFVNDLFK